MTRLWTIVGVRDVGASLRWYQSLLGRPRTAAAHDHFGQLLDADGTVLLCLHQWGAHEHPSLTSRAAGTPGNGLLLFFRVHDHDAALEQARALVSRLDEEPHVNPNTGTREFSLRDPDGYHVTVSEAPRPAGLLEAFADAWNRHDLDALMSMMTDDAVFNASAGVAAVGERHAGQVEVRAAFAAVFAHYPDAQWRGARHFTAGDRGVSEWTFTGTGPDGRPVEVAGCDLLTLRDGRIAIKDSYRKNRPPIR